MKLRHLLYTIAALVVSVSIPTQILAQTNIVGSWSGVTAYGSGQDDVYCDGLYNSDQEIRYGADHWNNGYYDNMCYYTNKPSGQSGLGFFGTQGLNFSCQSQDPNDPIVLYNLGEFKHFNQSVYIQNFGDPVYDKSLGGAFLNVTLGGELNESYSFWVDFEETPNNPSSYPQGNYQTNGCPYGTFNNKCNDRVSIENVVDPGNSVIIGGEQCQIVIEGFGSCTQETTQDGVEFITTEGSTNSSCIWASMSPPPAVYGVVGDYIWEDTNADGIQGDTEVGLNGIDVDVYESINNGPFFYRESTTSQDHPDTGAAGYYAFPNLETERAYKIFIDPATLVPGEITARRQGSARGKDSNAYATGFTNKFTVKPLKFKKNIDIGVVPNALVSTITGNVLFDRDGDATTGSAGEQVAPVPGVVVNLYEDHNGDGIGDGAPVQSQPTLGDGSYTFAGLNPSINYVVEVSNLPLQDAPGNPPTTLVALNAGNDDSIDSDFDPATGTTGSLNIEPQSILSNVDAAVNPGGIVIIVYGDELDGTTYNEIDNPAHVNNGLLYMGTGIDDDNNASIRSKPFAGTNLARAVLDDGIEGPTFIADDPVTGFSLDVTIESNAAATLSCFVDYDINGVFDADERTDMTVSGSGVYEMKMESTEDVVNGPSFARCRLAYDSSEIEAPGGLAGSGEVEDFPFNIGFQLPVELISFSGEYRGNSVVLNWTTGSEENNSGFYVERSVNGLAFERAGFVPGNGTTESVSNYTLTISNIDPGTNAFRLKQVDHDGQFEYSNVIEVSVDLPVNLHLSDAYPNPFNPQSTIRFTVKNQSEVSVGVYDLTGRLRSTLFEGVQDAGTTRELRIDASDLSSGTYFVQLTSGAEVVQKTITVAK